LVSGVSENRLKGSRYPFLSHAEFLEGEQELKDGDEIVTSGFGTIFPAKIPVGTVKEVQLSEGKVAQKTVIVPKVDFMKLTNVFVLTERKNGK
jgi:cell shape-determining protein MreC